MMVSPATWSTYLVCFLLLFLASFDTVFGQEKKIYVKLKVDEQECESTSDLKLLLVRYGDTVQVDIAEDNAIVYPNSLPDTTSKFFMFLVVNKDLFYFSTLHRSWFTKPGEINYTWYFTIDNPLFKRIVEYHKPSVFFLF